MALTLSNLMLLASLKRYGPQILVGWSGPGTRRFQHRVHERLEKEGFIENKATTLIYGLPIPVWRLTPKGQDALAKNPGRLAFYFKD